MSNFTGTQKTALYGAPYGERSFSQNLITAYLKTDEFKRKNFFCPKESSLRLALPDITGDNDGAYAALLGIGPMASEGWLRRSYLAHNGSAVITDFKKLIEERAIGRNGKEDLRVFFQVLMDGFFDTYPMKEQLHLHIEGLRKIYMYFCKKAYTAAENLIEIMYTTTFRVSSSLLSFENLAANLLIGAFHDIDAKHDPLFWIAVISLAERYSHAWPYIATGIKLASDEITEEIPRIYNS
ncbi:MAG: hypothetical protein LBI86_01025 [Treponema sp.]|jgi:hypothetical protein|nr:hypothetical protein [Treponema sp.]